MSRIDPEESLKYQKKLNLLGNVPNQPFKLRTKTWVEKNDESQGKYDEGNEFSLKTPMLRSRLCDYNDTYVLPKGSMYFRYICTSSVVDSVASNVNKKVIFNSVCLWVLCLMKPQGGERGHYV